jgi:SAM-dependent methyltransferase
MPEIVPTYSILFELKRGGEELFASYHAEPRDVTVVVGIRAVPHQPERLRNARICLKALNQQSLERWRYRVVVVEQDDIPRLEAEVKPLIDRYLFAYNPGPYNRGWGFNIAAMQPGADQGVLCLMDADFLVPPDFLQRGLEALAGGARAVIPYREVIYLDPAATDHVISTWEATASVASQVENHCCVVFSGSVGGSLWIDGSYYQASGGHNEEFRGWGGEDREFYNRLSRDVPIARLPARIYHLYHPRANGPQEVVRRNRALLKQIKHAGYLQPSGRIGDPGRYEAERPTARSAPRPAAHELVPAMAANRELGKRDWEHWHRWSEERIERIVTRERSRDPSQSVRGQLADLLAPCHGILLDVGCGPGALWVHLDRHRPRYSLVGVDATAKMVEVARRLFPSFEVRHADAAALPFAPRSFDAVLLRHVLEYLPRPLMTAAVAEATRVARGMVVLSFYARPRKTGPSRSVRVGRGFVETRWAASEITAAVARAGWRVGERLVLSDGRDRDEVWLLYAKG